MVVGLLWSLFNFSFVGLHCFGAFGRWNKWWWCLWEYPVFAVDMVSWWLWSHMWVGLGWLGYADPPPPNHYIFSKAIISSKGKETERKIPLITGFFFSCEILTMEDILLVIWGVTTMIWNEFVWMVQIAYQWMFAKCSVGVVSMFGFPSRFINGFEVLSWDWV